MKKRNRIEKRWFYGISKWFHLRNSFSASHGLWASQIRFIESRFGSGIVSYFALYRWNFTLNLLLALIWFAFVILFGILEMFQNDNYGWKAFWYGPNLDAPVEPGAFVQQLFSGQGSLERSFVLYGHYKARFSGYLLDVAYFVVIIVFYVLSFVAIIRR